MYLTGFAKSNHCALLQRSVREPGGRAERKSVVTSVCGTGFQLWVAGPSLPDTRLLSEGHGFNRALKVGHGTPNALYHLQYFVSLLRKEIVF